MIGYNFEDLWGRKILIEGEVGAGKTRLTSQLLNQAVELLPLGKVTVMDMAPSRRKLDSGHAGDPISKGEWMLKVRYLRPRNLGAPRLDGRSKAEVLAIAKTNALAISILLQEFLDSPSEVLFINDLTVFLHAGNIELLLEAISRSRTFIGNAYRGDRLSGDRGSGVTHRERLLLKEIEKIIDMIIRL